MCIRDRARNSFSLVKKKVSNVLLDSLDECTVSISTKEDNCSSLKSLNNLFSNTVLFVICVLWHFRGLKPGLRFKDVYKRQGREIICFSISSEMSTSINVIRMAAEELDAEDKGILWYFYHWHTTLFYRLNRNYRSYLLVKAV